jgi:hypothetical protein
MTEGPSGSAAAASTVAAPGVITSWSTNASVGNGQTETFKVYRPLGSEKYLVVGHDGPQALIPSTLNTFKTSIPVRAGDIIGNDDDNASTVPNACEFETANKSDTGFYAKGEAADGATITAENSAEEGVLDNLTATVVSAPTVSSITPSTGLTTAATSVTIAGTNFTEAGAVKFGAVPAASFRVNSDTQITAVAPANATPGAVDATVANAAGTSATSTADRFTYVAPPPPVITCTVPKLAGKKLKAAKKALLKAECKLGKVKGKKSSSAKVKSQKPKPGTVLSAGSKVNVTVK